MSDAYLQLLEQCRVKENALIDQRNMIKRTSGIHPDQAGEQTEHIFAELLAKLIPSEFKIVQRARISINNELRSPQIDILVLKPGGDKILNGINYYPRENVLAAFECKLTLRKADLAKIALTANTIKGDYAVGNINTATFSNVYPTCTPYFGVLALSWEGGDSLEGIRKLIDEVGFSLQRSAVGRMVDCFFALPISFISVFQEQDIFDKNKTELVVKYESILEYYEDSEGVMRLHLPNHAVRDGECSKQKKYSKNTVHNSLVGLGDFLSKIVNEYDSKYDFMVNNYVFYNNGLWAKYFLYEGPVCNFKLS
ncbi:DUF6602 domain-containing protein [Aquitalea sp. LB_tupeE]|uniref:DUF6602 domain-containing protein n=1 Tax=Aquitalea sp. LB_tupeE TaxID=2748078 RepID=UPI0015B9E715|nr:DUF6602 domain-containing protein [Aquitalea sp. LB_tupeE]NWK76856.1 hypothetical protein [Aquitalea sp. LB_tupeE]